MAEGTLMVSIPHLIGAIGELANFLGALFLAYDLTSRQSLENTKEVAALFNRHADASFDIQLPSVDRPISIGPGIDASHEIEKVHILLISKTTHIGVRLLALGFALLLVYHVMEILRP
jgi:hypothetical protein